MKLLYTIREFAELNGESYSAVHQQVLKGAHGSPAEGIPGAFKRGHRWVFPAAYIRYLNGDSFDAIGREPLRSIDRKTCHQAAEKLDNVRRRSRIIDQLTQDEYDWVELLCERLYQLANRCPEDTPPDTGITR